MTVARGRLSGRWAPLGIAALAVLFFAPGLFRGELPVFRDLLVLTIPLRAHARQAIRQAELPLWCPEIFFGCPFLANYQSAVLYPPSVLLYAMPFPLGLSLFLAVHLAVAGVGMARYLRARLALEPEAAVFGGVVFALGGFFVSLVPLTNQLQVAAWLPWALLWAAELRQRGGAKAFLALVGVLSLQGLGGAPEPLLLTAAAIAAEAVASGIGPPSGLRPTLRLAVAGACAAGVCAVQLLPTAEYAARTLRFHGLAAETVTAESLRLRSLQQLVLPHGFSGDAPGFSPEGGVPLFWSLYVGILPLSFALARASVRPLSGWAVAGTLATILALGDSIPVFPLLLETAPRIFGAFRYPAKFFLLAHTALAVLAAEGVAGTLRSRVVRRRALGLLGVLVATTALLSAWSVAAPGSFLEAIGFRQAPTLSAEARALLAADAGSLAARSFGFSALGALVLASFELGKLRRPAFVMLAVVVGSADLFFVHRPIPVFVPAESLESAVANVLPEGVRVFHYRTERSGAQGDRIQAWNGTIRPGESAGEQAQFLWAAAVPDTGLLQGLASVAGVDGFATIERIEFFRTIASLPRERAIRLLGSLGVEALVGPEPLSSDSLDLAARETADSDSSWWAYRLRERAPRAYLAERVVYARELGEALLRAAESGYRPGRDAVLLGDPAAGPRDLAPGAIEEISWQRQSLRARVSLPGPGLLVVADSWFPGWEATIDGRPAPILRANGIVRAVEVPAGRHEVQMSYRPATFRIGAAVSLFSTISTLLLGLLFSRGRRLSTTP